MKSLIIPLFIITLPLWAQDFDPQDFTCPEGRFKTDFTSPISNHRRLFCSKRSGDEFVQDGPEWEFDKDGAFLAQRNFKDGAEVELTAEQVERQKPKELSATEQLGLPPDFGFMRTAITEFLYIVLPIARPERNIRVFYGGFATNSCYRNTYMLRRFYEEPARDEHHLRLRFGERCSLQGDGTLLMGRRNRLVFEPRLTHYERLEMSIEVQSTPREEDDKFFVQIKIHDGALIQQTGRLRFEAEYALILGSSAQLTDAHGGEVRVLSENGRELNLKYPLKLQERPD